MLYSQFSHIPSNDQGNVAENVLPLLSEEAATRLRFNSGGKHRRTSFASGEFGDFHMRRSEFTASKQLSWHMRGAVFPSGDCSKSSEACVVRSCRRSDFQNSLNTNPQSSDKSRAAATQQIG